VVADDSQGYCYALDPDQSCAVVAIDPTNGSIDIVADTFEDFLRERLAD
jgi:hypothetical protein